ESFSTADTRSVSSINRKKVAQPSLAEKEIPKTPPKDGSSSTDCPFDDASVVPVDWSRSMSRTTHFVLYDDQCPMCTFQMRVVTWLDWFNVTTLVPMSDPRAKAVAPSLSPEDLS